MGKSAQSQESGVEFISENLKPQTDDTSIETGAQDVKHRAARDEVNMAVGVKRNRTFYASWRI